LIYDRVFRLLRLIPCYLIHSRKNCLIHLFLSLEVNCYRFISLAAASFLRQSNQRTSHLLCAPQICTRHSSPHYFPSLKANQQLELRLLPANNLLSPKSASNNLISLGILPSICSKQAVTLLFYFPHRTTPPFPFSPIDQQEASCSNIFSFPQSSQSACSPVPFLSSQINS
jgi:hypothetical protein